MKRSRRILSLLLTAMVLLCIAPLKVSANSPEPAPFYTFYLSNLPEGAAYVDLLIYLPRTDEMYTDLITSNIPDSFSPDAQILTYCENDFRSYTFYYRDALSMLKLGREDEVLFFADDTSNWNEAHIRFDHAADIDLRGHVKLAMLDEQGNILMITAPLDLTNVSKFSYRLGDFYFDCATGELIIEHIENNKLDPPGHYIISGVFGILLTCVVEWLTGLLFELKGYGLLIAGTNVVSQILMRLAYAAFYLYSSWGYFAITLLLEGCVYLGEFLWYSRRIQSVSGKTALLYTVLANSLSWCAGHMVNLFVFFGMFIMI